MKSVSTPTQSPAHNHQHDHAHAHTHTHEHGDHHAQGHMAALGATIQQPVADLKSPVLIGLGQRLLWVAFLLVALWLVVYWALRTNG